jgi:hypothetical protein
VTLGNSLIRATTTNFSRVSNHRTTQGSNGSHSPSDLQCRFTLGLQSFGAFPSLTTTTQKIVREVKSKGLGVLIVVLLLFHPTNVRDSDISQTDLVHTILKTKGFLLLRTYSRYPSWSFVTLMTQTLAHTLCFSLDLGTWKSHMCTSCAISPLILGLEKFTYALLALALRKLMLSLLSYLNL